MKINIPPITSIDNALKIYYNHNELTNREISILFGKLSSSTLAKLKKSVKIEMANQNKPSYRANSINTILAYQIWGIDVADLENRKKKLKDLDL